MQGIFRVYFNRRGAPSDEGWSIDRGHGTRRRHFAYVVLLTSPARFIYNHKEPDWKNPIGWVQVGGELTVERTKKGHMATIRPLGMLSKKKEKSNG